VTNAEAIAELRNMQKFNYTLAPDEVFQMAISALEKQEGKKPKLHPKPLKNEVFWWNCPHCGAHNHTNTMHNFCHHCGGRIDWGDEHGTD
jgi:hypothetical protein